MSQQARNNPEDFHRRFSTFVTPADTGDDNLCPRCRESLVYPNARMTDSQPYCEECGWPNEDFDKTGQ